MSSHAAAATAAAGTFERRRSRSWAKFKRSPSAMLGAGIVLFFVLVALFAPLIAGYDPAQVSFTAIRKAPSAAHWLGTDELGRDILSRMVYGARASLLAGMCSVLIALAAGVPFGLLAGYFGGLIDGCISRATEALLSIPFLILAIALAAFLGPSLVNAMIAIGVSAAPLFIRLARGQVLAIKNEDYVQSTRSLGASNTRIILRHILPNVMPALIVQATIMIASAIIAEASLSFLGLGLQPPNPSWGSMLNTAKNFMTQAPWMSIFPGSAIFLVVFGFNLLGDGLRDALDPRQEH
jgi:ABC-type dipeptide/oligopeptide/nickel transport system permease subunit